MDIKLSNIVKKYKGSPIFDGLNCAFVEGEITCILGGSGTGKTTLLNIIASLTDYEGTVEGVQKDSISYVFQSARLLPALTVYGNVDIVLRGKIHDKAERDRVVREVLTEVGLGRDLNKLPAELSGGMAQRVALARAFAYPSELLLLDEPFNALDVALKSKLLTSFLDLYDRRPRTTIFVTHDILDAVTVADRILVLGGAPCDVKCDLRPDEPRAERNAFSDKTNELKRTLYDALLN